MTSSNEKRPKYIFCHECNRGGNGKDVDKCSCGWQQVDKSTLGCYLGEKMEELLHEKTV